MKITYNYEEIEIPDSKKTTGKICNIASDLTLTNRDLDSKIHKGFTIGKGKKLYFMMVWHGSGNVTVYEAEGNDTVLKKRWISGDTIITVHFH